MHLGRILVLTDGSEDAEFKATGFLDALNLNLSIELQVIELSVKKLNWWLSQVPYCILLTLKKFEKFIFGDIETIDIVKRFNEGSILIVACGTNTIPTVVEIKHMYPEKVYTIFIGHPHCNYKLFDSVLVPSHELIYHGIDPLPRNAIKTTGCVNRATYRLLKSCREYASDQFSGLKSPVVVIYIGRPTSQCPYLISGVLDFLCTVVKSAIDKGIIGTTVVVFAKNTLKKAILKLSSQDWLKEWRGDFLCALTWANFVIATADALIPCCEAASAGKPLFTLAEECCIGPSVHFFTQMRSLGVSKPLTSESLSEYGNGWKYTQLNTSIDAANAAADRIAKAKADAVITWYRS